MYASRICITKSRNFGWKRRRNEAQMYTSHGHGGDSYCTKLMINKNMIVLPWLRNIVYCPMILLCRPGRILLPPTICQCEIVRHPNWSFDSIQVEDIYLTEKQNYKANLGIKNDQPEVDNIRTLPGNGPKILCAIVHPTDWLCQLWSSPPPTQCGCSHLCPPIVFPVK